MVCGAVNWINLVLNSSWTILHVNVEYKSGLSYTRTASSGGFYEHGDGSSGSINYRNFLEQLIKNRLLKMKLYLVMYTSSFEVCRLITIP
jgi:hypothetical protein